MSCVALLSSFGCRARKHTAWTRNHFGTRRAGDDSSTGCWRPAREDFLASVVYPVVRYRIPPPTREATTNSVTLSIDPETIAPNTGQIFKFGREPGIVLQTPTGELRAFSAVCTTPRLHRAVSRRPAAHMVRLSQWTLRPEWREHSRTSAAPTGRAVRRPGRRKPNHHCEEDVVPPPGAHSSVSLVGADSRAPATPNRH